MYLGKQPHNLSQSQESNYIEISSSSWLKIQQETFRITPSHVTHTPVTSAQQKEDRNSCTIELCRYRWDGENRRILKGIGYTCKKRGMGLERFGFYSLLSTLNNYLPNGLQFHNTCSFNRCVHLYIIGSEEPMIL